MADLSIDMMHLDIAKAMQRLLVSMIDDDAVPERYRNAITMLLKRENRERIDISELMMQ